MEPVKHLRKAVLTKRGQIDERSVGLVGWMRDVLDEERGSLQPLSAVLFVTAVILGGMVTYNAMFNQHVETTQQVVASGSGAGETRVDVSVPVDGANTIVIKYDPAVEEVQRALLESGIYRGAVDGVNGQRTKLAIQQYQQANGLPVTGEASKGLATHVLYTNKLKAASEFTGSVSPAPQIAAASPVVTEEPDAPASNQSGNSELPPAAIQKSVSQVPDNAAKAMRIKRVQIALSSLGYSAGKVTGALNDATKAAILKFEMDNGLSMDGVVDADLLRALQITTSN